LYCPGSSRGAKHVLEFSDSRKRIAPCQHVRFFEIGAAAFDRKSNSANVKRQQDANLIKIEMREAKLQQKNEVIAKLLQVSESSLRQQKSLADKSRSGSESGRPRIAAGREITAVSTNITAGFREITQR